MWLGARLAIYHLSRTLAARRTSEPLKLLQNILRFFLSDFVSTREKNFWSCIILRFFFLKTSDRCRVTIYLFYQFRDHQIIELISEQTQKKRHQLLSFHQGQEKKNNICFFLAGKEWEINCFPSYTWIPNCIKTTTSVFHSTNSSLPSALGFSSLYLLSFYPRPLLFYLPLHPRAR